MKNKTNLNLVLCWHMHQPWYMKSIDGDYQLPWVYLHALKDYTDMAMHLETHPKINVVVNFTPILLVQLDDYAEQFKSWQNNPNSKQPPFREDMLNYISGHKNIPQSEEQKKQLVKDCLRLNYEQMLEPYPAFVKMIETIRNTTKQECDPQTLKWMNDQFYLDLVIWYHISWLGYSLKINKDIQALMKKGSNFSRQDRVKLLSVMTQAMTTLIDRYKVLSDKDQIELSMTPFGHPIAPLLIDFKSMHDALPVAPSPASAFYPGGKERVRWHMDEGIRLFEKFFGCKPKGIWLAEGSVSEDSIALLDEYDISWTASGEGVWHNSCYLSGLNTQNDEARQSLFRCHELNDYKTKLFFRDDGLSDLIGFDYQKWAPLDAAGDFIHNVNNIATYLEHAPGDHVVSVILDGENAWEYYPDNGYHFIHCLYTALEENSEFNLITYEKASLNCPPHKLSRVCAGSWVYGSFSTWIGDRDKNYAWDLLTNAKKAYDEYSPKLSKKQLKKAELQLAICESSDWFWWFGDYNPSHSVADFDNLFRLQLKNLYQLLDQDAPEILDISISKGGGKAANAGTMRRGHE